MTDPSGLDSSDSGEAQFWTIAWRIAAAAFIGLLAVCGYWVANQGFSEAIMEPCFQWFAVAAIFTGILVLARYTIRAFTEGFVFDRRNMALRGRAFGNWFVPRQGDDGKR